MNKPSLVGFVQEITVVNASDFDNFVTSIYGGDFETAAIQEFNYNSYVKHTVPDKFPEQDWIEEEKAQIRNGDYPDYCAYRVLDCLYEDGHIPEGTYLIISDH